MISKRVVLLTAVLLFLIAGAASASPGTGNACPFRATDLMIESANAWDPPAAKSPAGVGKVIVAGVPELLENGNIDPKRPISTTVLLYKSEAKKMSTWWFHLNGEVIAGDAKQIRGLGAKQLDELPLPAKEIAELKAGLATYRNLKEFRWHLSVSVIEMKDVPVKDVLQTLAELVPSVKSKQTIFTKLATPMTADEVQARIATIGEDVASLDAKTVLVQSNDGKQLVLARREGAKQLFFLTDTRTLLSEMIDALPADVAVIYKGTRLILKSDRLVLFRAADAPAAIGKAVSQARSNRRVKPTALVSGLPRDEAQLTAQRLAPGSLPGYQQLHGDVAAAGKKLGARMITTKKELLNLLEKGNGDLAILVAHSDGTRLYVGGEELTLAEVTKLPNRSSPASRALLVAACETGGAAHDANLESFAETFVKKGYAATVLAPTKTIFSTDVQALFDNVGKPLQKILEALSKQKGWRIWVLRGLGNQHEEA